MAVEFIVHAPDIKNRLSAAKTKALSMCGVIAEGYALTKVPSPSDKGSSGNLRQSIHFRVVDGDAMEVFSNSKYAGYVEYGTGSESTFPGGGATNKPSWVYPAGIGADGKMTFRTAYPMKARPFIKPSIADHISEYENLIKTELGG